MDIAHTQADNSKRQRVLGAAMSIFLSYGFKRVTMDDIAHAAEMSRPALYLLFRNKNDIFRAVTDMVFVRMLDVAEERLKATGDLGTRLNAAIEDGMICLMQEVSQSPHGEELLDMKNSIAAELIAGWNNALAAIVRDAITADAKVRGVDLCGRGVSAQTLAEMLLDGVQGLKQRQSDAAAQRKGAQQLVRVVELAIA